ncbi:MAG: peptidoglycan DD-metalloendopeptidase family protein [Oscillospiraceae bacterium]|nr:peptidoglycan DD-metalloendopeptidase family protein [Oscillospiraceae bacterium]
MDRNLTEKTQHTDAPVQSEHKMNLEELANWIYHLLYYIGSKVIRYGKRAVKFAKHAAVKCWWFAKRNAVCFVDFLVEQKNEILHSSWIDPFRSIVNDWKRDFINLGSSIKNRDMEAFKDTLFDMLHTFRFVGNVVNYVLPVMACIFFVSTFQEIDSQTYALSVEYNGEQIGYIRNEAEFTTAENDVQNRIISGDYEFPDDYIPQYTLQVVEEEQLSTVDELADRIIEVSGNEIQEASGLYIDGEFIGATTDGEGLVLALKDMLDETRETAGEDAKVSFVQDVKVDEALYPVSSIVDLSDISAELTKEVAAARTYIIQPGDTPYDVANTYDVPLETLLRNNEEVVKRFLPGDSLLIQSAVPMLEQKVTMTVTEEKTLNFKTEQVLNSNYEKGYTKIKTNGQTGVEEVVYEVTYVDGFETERNVVSRTTVKEPVNAVLEVGTLMPAQYLNNVSGGNVGGFIWPVDGGYISCPIWGYYGHTGTDIATKTGTAVRASAAGTVTYSGWQRGYGYTVIINHGNGIRTLYAHNSALHVVAGQYVQQGQLIASVGSTGNSTGPHCHFEIIVNNSYKDARQYIGYTYPGR